MQRTLGVVDMFLLLFLITVFNVVVAVVYSLVITFVYGLGQLQ